MKKITILIMSAVFLITAACSDKIGADNLTAPIPDTAIEESMNKSEMQSISAAPEGFSRPGLAAEAEGYTFFTDYRSVYRIKNQTGETIKIFNSDNDILYIFEYSGYMFVGFSVDKILRMDYNGNNIIEMKDMHIIFGADGYIYYDNGGGLISRKTLFGEKDELIFDWFGETKGADDIGPDTDCIGYHNGKVYFQKDHKIYTLTKDGDRKYYCDGDYHSMKDSILILEKDKTFYRKDVDAGNEYEIYSYKGSYDYDEYVNGKYLGKYKDKEYYLMDGNIFSAIISENKMIVQEKLPYRFVEYAAVSNGWIYVEYLDKGLILSRYNLITGDKEPISELPYMTPEKLITECNDHLYYVNGDENGLFRIDLNDDSIKQVYSGKMYVLHMYI